MKLRHQRWGTLAFGMSLEFVAIFPAGADEENTIVIRGNRRETSTSRTTGRSLLIRPKEASRFDTLTHLKRESSVTTSETGRVSPSGFVVPKVRGQDVKLTDVYLEDILLQDPYSGLPLVEDMDLRAFGSLEIHQGLAPAEVANLNPIGTLRYKFQEAATSSVAGGMQAGPVFGLSTWSLGVFHKGTDSDATDARLYVRHHQTRGRYPYYSDEGTPFNTSDDCMRIRENNDQQSLQVVPFIRQRSGPYKIQALGWVYQADRGLPSMSAAVPSSAREKPDGFLGNVQLVRYFSAFGPFSGASLGLGLMGNRDQRTVEDPGRRFLGSAEQSHMHVHAKRVNISSKVSAEKADVFANLELGATSVEHHLGQRQVVDLQRLSELASLGLRLNPLPLWTIEAKAAHRHHRDSFNGDADLIVMDGEQAVGTRPSSSHAFGGAVAFGQRQQGVYLQTAYATRLPSLIEEFGNGSSIRANPQLSPEDTHHREIGGFLARGHERSWRLGVAGYEDTTSNKVVFVPVMGNAVKALNVRKTTIRGLDLRSEFTWDTTTLYGTFSRLFPYDLTRDEHRLLPGISERVWVGELEQRLGSSTLRWLARYRSEVYRDLANSLELPGAWIHDASVDYLLKLAGTAEVRASLSLRNVFNVMSVEIRAPDTSGNEGRTAYSDIAGAPLPGRQWLLSLAVTK
jgi:hypothetical protein